MRNSMFSLTFSAESESMPQSFLNSGQNSSSGSPTSTTLPSSMTTLVIPRVW